MARTVTVWIAVLLGGVNAAAAAGRLAVLEFFGRPSGGYCSAAGPAMRNLQLQLEGQAVLLEYDYDRFQGDRLFRFWATGVSAGFLPLVMVGSGYRTSSGQADYENVYRSMILDELARPPRAAIAAAWRPAGTAMRTYLTITNTGGATLRRSEEAAAWVVAYEKTVVGVSSTWVRMTRRWPLPDDLAPGETVHAVVDLPGLSGVDWNRMAAVALLEDRPGGNGRYDMLQATEALPPAVLATPRQLMVHPGRPAVEVALEGPHVLDWSATVDVPWLEVSPAAGRLPADVTVVLLPELRPPEATAATVTIRAVGDSMDLETELPVLVGAPVRQPSGRVRPGP